MTEAVRVPFRVALCLAVHATFKVFFGILRHSWGLEVNDGDKLEYPYTITVGRMYVPWYGCKLKR